jgi:hypothetical protein
MMDTSSIAMTKLCYLHRGSRARLAYINGQNRMLRSAEYRTIFLQLNIC